LGSAKSILGARKNSSGELPVAIGLFPFGVSSIERSMSVVSSKGVDGNVLFNIVNNFFLVSTISKILNNTLSAAICSA
jgi:hypothetical protein